MPDRYGEEDQPIDMPDVEWSAYQRHLVEAMAVVNCHLCDDDGYHGSRVCDHVDRTETAKRGTAKVRAAMGWDK